MVLKQYLSITKYVRVNCMRKLSSSEMMLIFGGGSDTDALEPVPVPDPPPEPSPTPTLPPVVVEGPSSPPPTPVPQPTPAPDPGGVYREEELADDRDEVTSQITIADNERDSPANSAQFHAQFCPDID